MRSLRFQRLRFVFVTVGLAAAVVALGLRLDEPEPSRPTGPVIDEFGTSNADTIADADGDHPDWVEIHNPTDQPIDVTGWYLTDDPGQPDRWSFPTTVLEPGQRLVVFASGKDRAEAGTELHTNFRLSREGEPLLLVDSSGNRVADRHDPVPLPRGASYGRDPDDPSRTCYFAVPRPGSQNAPECFDDVRLGAPELSLPSGFYDDELTLEISSDDDSGATLYYTLDGSFPDPVERPGRTHVYHQPLTLRNLTPEAERLAMIDATTPGDLLQRNWVQTPPDINGPIPKGTVVRARTEFGAESVATYFIGSEAAPRGLPTMSLVLDEDHLFDPEFGIYVAGDLFDDYVASDRFDPLARWSQHEANYMQSGAEWQRPRDGDLRNSAVFEFCSEVGACGHQVEVGVRIHGNYGRVFPRKALRLYADDNPAGPQFGEQLFGDPALAAHRRVLLRASGNDNHHLTFKDAYLQSLMSSFDADTQASRSAALFINGEYWGLYNIRERYDQHYFSTVHGADPETVVILDRHHEVVRGAPDGNDLFRSFLNDVMNTDPSDPQFVDNVESMVDVESFFDFVIAHVFVANPDWPFNNTRVWRQPEATDDIGTGPLDGRWRWMIFDLDQAGSGLDQFHVEYDVFTDRMAPTDDEDLASGYPFVFHRFMQNDDLRVRFLTSFSDHLNTTFRPERTVAELDAWERLLAPEMERHVARWGAPESVDAWHDIVEALRTFMQERPNYQRTHLEALFGLDTTVGVTVTTEPDRGHVRINQIDLTTNTPGVHDPSSWTGRYWPGVPLTFEAIPRDGQRFERWVGVTGAPTSPILHVELTSGRDVDVRAVFVAD